MVRDIVFIVTNILLLVSAMVGLAMLLWHRRINPEERRSLTRLLLNEPQREEDNLCLIRPVHPYE